MHDVPTPMDVLSRLGERMNVSLRCKRDDLYPLTGGGNKARKIALIAEDIRQSGCDAVVTTGGAQSNHARAVALAAAQHGWRCHLILHGHQDDLRNPSGNLLIALLTGAKVDIVEPDMIAVRMQAAMESLSQQGFRPAEILGGGHCVTGAMAYALAVEELSHQCSDDRWIPEYIVHASGTGTTQAGIMAGVERLGWDTQVIGVSVARRNPRGRQVVDESYRELRQRLGIAGTPRDVDFRDDWIGNGYEQADDTVLETIRAVAQIEGIILDPTYSGKAFTGLMELVAAKQIPEGARVLFWHTGGLLNLLASSYFSEGSAVQ